MDNNREGYSLDQERVTFFQRQILQWFSTNARDLPWRRTRDPYKVWVSEVILQQTRVAQGWEYYERFVKRYPTVADLAESSEEELLLMWQGLGYYSRAHHMHEAAKSIMNSYGGVFPRAPKDVRTLQGVGEYTAAAICSISYGEPMAVLDGNVYRVISRFECLQVPIDTTSGRKLYRALADGYLERKAPGAYNQALMDLGAMVCTPSTPHCDSCPLSERCASVGTKWASLLPIKARKIQTKTLYLDYLCLLCGDHFLVQRRGKGSIWKGLYQFPVHSSEQKNMSEGELSLWMERLLPPYRHIKTEETTHLLSHRILHIRIHTVYVDDLEAVVPEGEWIPVSSHHTLAFPRPLRAFLDAHFSSEKG